MTRDQAEILLGKLLHARATAQLFGGMVKDAGRFVSESATEAGIIWRTAHDLSLAWHKIAEQCQEEIIAAMTK